MELSNPHAFGAKGVKKPTRDFLSLYTSEDHQDPISIIPADDYLKTQDFLRPLEHVGKNVGNEGLSVENSKSFTPPTTVEHILPGGMGTYSISHISYVNQNQSQKVPKPRGIVISATQSSSSDNNDENSNCSSYTRSGFTLWEDSNVNKGKTRKENIARTRQTMRNEGMKIGVPWMTTEQPSQSSSIHNHPSTTFGSLSSSRPTSAPKNRYADTLKFGKGVQQEEDNDEVFVIKKEPTFHNKGPVRVDSANHDQKPNSPRSKHSATEQRRRSKINDRFSLLRRILPHGDQKRDKASFLLEVIEYIQFLQEKVHKYEDSGQGWTNEPSQKIPLHNNGPTINIVDQPQLPTSSLDAFKETGQHPVASHIHISTPDTITTASEAQPQLAYSRSCKTDYSITSDKLKDQEVITESGIVSISTIYSQGLSSALTEALKSSGVDLSHAKISVKIDLGKRSKTRRLDSLPPDLKENEVPSIDQSLTRSSGEGFKRLKTSRY